MKYAVTVVETLCRTVTVEADNEDDALDIVERAYYNDEIELDSSYYLDSDFEVREADEYDVYLLEVC